MCRCDCGGRFRPRPVAFKGFVVESMQCSKCGEIVFSPKQIDEVIKLQEANKKIESKRKIVKIGDSIATTLPKKLEEFGIHEGLSSDIRVLSPKSLEIRFNKDVFR